VRLHPISIESVAFPAMDFGMAKKKSVKKTKPAASKKASSRIRRLRAIKKKR
jgi:hypothetical protein